MTEAKKLFVKTYGCQMNVYDSERMAEALGAKGYVTTDVVEDVANQRWLCAVVDKVEPMTAADLTRREFESTRARFR